MENLSEFEPRRWFRKVNPETPKEAAQTGLSSLTVMDQDDEEPLPVLGAADLAPGWERDGAILCIGGRTALDDAAAVMLAGLLRKHGLKAEPLDHDAITEGRIVSLEADVKLVCLSYLGLGVSRAHVRYLVRRLRRIVPNAIIVVGYWGEDSEPAMKALRASVEADAYATTLHEATDIVLEAASKSDPELDRPLEGADVSLRVVARTARKPRPRTVAS
jgi:hypothetical protein